MSLFNGPHQIPWLTERSYSLAKKIRCISTSWSNLSSCVPHLCILHQPDYLQFSEDTPFFFCNPIYGHANVKLQFVYLGMCVSGHMHVHHVYAGWKKALSYEGREIFDTGAGNGSQALCKDSKRSSKTLFRPCCHFLNSKLNVTQGQSSMTDSWHAWLLKAPHWRNVPLTNWQGGGALLE